MENGIVIKKYEVDYSFIIRNYLSPKMWEKVWTLFLYKNFRFTLQINSISVYSTVKITFRISLDNGDFKDFEFADYDVDHPNLNVLKRQIDGAIKRLIHNYENHLIVSTTEYRELREKVDEEQEKLRDIASDFLDDNGITLSDIRDAYIDKFVDDNWKGYIYLSAYVDNMAYKLATDLWLIYAKSTNNSSLEEDIKDSLSDTEYQNKLNEIQDYINMMKDDSSDAYVDYFYDAQNNLESI